MSAPVLRAQPDASRAALEAVVERRFRASMEVPTRFFEAHAGDLVAACHAMARRFRGGGRLLVFGEGAQATDAHHAAVEFVHPVLVGKRALPALALTSDVASLTAQEDDAFAGLLELFGRPEDIALGLCVADTGRVARGLAVARRRGLLTVGLGGARGVPEAEHGFAVPSPDPMVVQEVHETAYHVLWELVHVFLDQRSPA